MTPLSNSGVERAPDADHPGAVPWRQKIQWAGASRVFVHPIQVANEILTFYQQEDNDVSEVCLLQGTVGLYFPASFPSTMS